MFGDRLRYSPPQRFKGSHLTLSLNGSFDVTEHGSLLVDLDADRETVDGVEVKSAVQLVEAAATKPVYR